MLLSRRDKFTPGNFPAPTPTKKNKKTNDGPFRLDLPRDGSLLASSSIASASECPTTSAIRVGCRVGGVYFGQIRR